MEGTENCGLRGPVHTVETTSQELNPDPRKERRLPSGAGVATGWMEFDDHGSLLASGTDASRHEKALHNFYRYDAQGRMLERANWAADGMTLIRQVYRYGPFGPVEVQWLNGEKLTGRTTVEYDEHGNFVRNASYDTEGRLGHESVQKVDQKTGTVEEEGLDAEGTSQVHVVDRLDEKSEIYEHQALDEKGRVTSILRLYNGEFLSWWLSPDFQCAPGQMEAGIFNWNDEERRFQIYFTLRCPGTLEITKLHHDGKEGSLENDLEERYLADGKGLERVECQYSRDDHQNWTKRVVLVWDAKADKMIAVGEEQRTITYYKNSEGGN
jgi:hypothetical protein